MHCCTIASLLRLGTPLNIGSVLKHSSRSLLNTHIYGKPVTCVVLRGVLQSDMAHALQAVRMCYRLAYDGLGSIVEACDSAPEFLVGCLRDWADTGALVLQTSALCSYKEKMVEPASATCEATSRSYIVKDHFS